MQSRDHHRRSAELSSLAIPAFAREAVDQQETYERNLADASRAILEVVGTGKVPFDEVINGVAARLGIDKVVVHTAITRLLRARDLRSVNGDQVTRISAP